MSKDVVAEVIVRAPDGTSILDAAEAVTDETVGRYRPSEEAMSEVTALLEAEGVEVVARGPTGLTVSAEAETIARVFGSAQAPTVPEELATLVAAVVLPEQPELFP
jgi:hypothetical protein